MKLLSRSEEIVLLSILKLQDNAYGVTIREEVIKTTGYDWSIGALYAPLHRLEKKKLVKTRKGSPSSERGGRSKIFYEVTLDGKRALLKVKDVNKALWKGAPELSFEEK